MSDVDPRLALLLRAGVKHDLVAAGVESLDDAFDDVVHAVHIIEPCEQRMVDQMVERWERWDRKRGWDRQRRQQWRRR